MTHPHMNKRRKSVCLQDIFASNVLFHRKRLGISQEELAELCGYHRTYIGSVERGERNVTIATIEALASVFGVSPHELLVPKDND
ncbi:MULTISPECIES: helix-turn-helix domain-containing protein [Aeromonas]|uniref:helix-turn-helix domain-containing protein n=1 Tax=Aeromonas TaxID=642 RepID=UPI001F34D207|nr:MULTISPECIES: helix-turn-helix transcriptional regulator [Aeromonas]MCE9932666.1 helix-turn-helix transcriptional regulator [Aeromonas salmonicida]